MVEFVLKRTAVRRVSIAALCFGLSYCDSSHDDGGDSETARRGPPWNECQSFSYYACCAWGCMYDLYASDCPRGIPGLSDEADSAECLVDAQMNEVSRREGPDACMGSTSTVAACELTIECLRGKGTVSALTSLGYPPPSPGTMMCPPMPGADLDAAMNIDAAPTPDAAASSTDDGG